MTDFKEIARIPTEQMFSVRSTANAERVWVGVFDSSVRDRLGGRQVWSRTYERPAGKTLQECAEAALRAVLGGLARGEVALNRMEVPE